MILINQRNEVCHSTKTLHRCKSLKISKCWNPKSTKSTIFGKKTVLVPENLQQIFSLAIHWDATNPQTTTIEGWDRHGRFAPSSQDAKKDGFFFPKKNLGCSIFLISMGISTIKLPGVSKNLKTMIFVVQLSLKIPWKSLKF